MPAGGTKFDLLLLAVTTVSHACDVDWIAHSGSCYRPFSSRSGYDAAEDLCVEHGGHLTSIHSQEEDAFVESVQITYLSGAAFWIGLKRLSSTEFVWSDGTSFTYSNMVANPTAYQGECLAKFPAWQSHQWAPSNCPSEYGFLCKQSQETNDRSEWGEWSACDCERGTQTRLRGGHPSLDYPEVEAVDRACQCSLPERSSAVAVLISEGYSTPTTPSWVGQGRQTIECSRHCLTHPGCLAFQFDQTTGTCHMFDQTIAHVTSVISPGSSLWQFLPY